MRDRESIEHEIEVKRDELEAGVAQLKDVVLDRVNVKRRARRALEHGKEEAIEATSRARSLARDRPELVIALIAGAVTLISLGVAVQRRRKR
jgi:hypothetical protein